MNADETVKIERQVQRISKYPIVGHIGQGAMGEVWLARHPDLDIPVAIKTLHSRFVRENPSYIVRFRREARLAALVNHPSVVRVYDSGQDGDIYFLVMEYVAGGTAKSLLASHDGPLPVELAVSIVRDISCGLVEAARHGVIHRDIKPENIMLSVDGRAKLGDLGIAKIADPMGMTEMTATGIAMGTPLYISPEQIRSPKSADCRSDIYSLGATFFELLTGNPPYDDESAFTVLEMHIQNPVPDVSAFNDAVTPGLASIVTRALAKNPDERFQTAAELLDAIGDDIPQTAIPLPPAALRPSPTPLPDETIAEPPPVPIAGQDSPLHTGLIAAAIAAVAILLFAIVAKKPPPPSASVSPPPPAASGTDVVVVVQPSPKPEFNSIIELERPDPSHALPVFSGKRPIQPPIWDAAGMWLMTAGPMSSNGPGMYGVNEYWRARQPFLRKGKIRGYVGTEGTKILSFPMPPKPKAFESTVVCMKGSVSFKVEVNGIFAAEKTLNIDDEAHFSVEFKPENVDKRRLITHGGMGAWCNPTVFQY